MSIIIPLLLAGVVGFLLGRLYQDEVATRQRASAIDDSAGLVRCLNVDCPLVESCARAQVGDGRSRVSMRQFDFAAGLGCSAYVRTDRKGATNGV